MKKNYNLSEIMKKAWAYKKAMKVSMSDALKAAWAIVKSGKGLMHVKAWFFDKVNSAAMNYNIMLMGEYKDGMLDHTVFRVERVVAETEKAVKVELDAETFSGYSRTWSTWVPKSVIVA